MQAEEGCSSRETDFPRERNRFPRASLARTRAITAAFVPDVGVFELAGRANELAEEPQPMDGVNHLIFLLEELFLFPALSSNTTTHTVHCTMFAPNAECCQISPLLNDEHAPSELFTPGGQRCIIKKGKAS